MNNYLKILTGDGLIYGFASVITKLVHIFLVPLYSANLSPEEYGQFSLINSIMVISNLLVFFSLESAVSLYYYKTEDNIEKEKVFGNWISFMWFISFLIGLSLFLLRETLAKYIFEDPKATSYIDLIAVNTLFFGLQYILVVYFRYQRRPWPAVFIALLLTVTTLAGNYFFVSLMQYNIAGILYSHICISLMFSILGIYFLRHCISLSKFDYNLLKKMIKFASPLVPASILRFILMYAILYYIDYFTSKEQVGIYQVGATVAGIIRLFVLAFMIPWNTIWYSISREQNANEIYRDIVNIFLGVGLLGAVSITLSSDLLINIFSTSEYLGAINILGLLAINHIIMGLPQITLVGSAIKGNNKPYLFAIAIGCLITLISLLLLVPPFGIVGACYGLIIGSISVQVSLIYFVNKINHIAYRYDYIFLLITGALLLNYVFNATDFLQSFIIYRLLLFSVYASLVVYIISQSLTFFRSKKA